MLVRRPADDLKGSSAGRRRSRPASTLCARSRSGHILSDPDENSRSESRAPTPEEVRSEGARRAHARGRVPRPRGRQAEHASRAGGVHGRAGGEGRAGRRRPPRPVALHQPRAQHARLLRARARRGSRREQSPARAGEVRRHRRLDPRRVLHGAYRRPPAAGRGRRLRGLRGRLHAAAAAAHRAGARLGHHEGGAPVLQRPQARTGRRRHPHRRLRRPGCRAARHAA